MFPTTPVKEDTALAVLFMMPPVPLMMLHVPVPTAGEFAASDMEVPQTV